MRGGDGEMSLDEVLNIYIFSISEKMQLIALASMSGGCDRKAPNDRGLNKAGVYLSFR